jgi:dihydrofolate reductase
MRKLIVSTFLTLDGVMQGPGGPEEDEEGGFTSGGWTVPHWDEDLSAFMGETMTPPFDLVLGRRTYELFASFWPNHPDQPGAKPLNDATKYVASRGRPALEWGPRSRSRETRPKACRRSRRARGQTCRSTAARTCSSR